MVRDRNELRLGARQFVFCLHELVLEPAEFVSRNVRGVAGVGCLKLKLEPAYVVSDTIGADGELLGLGAVMVDLAPKGLGREFQCVSVISRPANTRRVWAFAEHAIVEQEPPALVSDVAGEEFAAKIAVDAVGVGDERVPDGGLAELFGVDVGGERWVVALELCGGLGRQLDGGVSEGVDAIADVWVICEW